MSIPSERGSWLYNAPLPFRPSIHPILHLSSNRNFDLDTSLNIDDDLLDNLGRGVETIFNEQSIP